MLQTEAVTDPAQSEAAAEKVTEFPRAVHGGRVEEDVRVNVLLIDMCGDDELVLSLREAHGEFVANLLRFLRRDFAGGKGLANLVKAGRWRASRAPIRFADRIRAW